ncbi:MAG: alpha/beta hydrolase [Polyangiales bacterium]
MATPSPSVPPTASPIQFELPNGITIAADAYGDPAGQPVVLMHGGGQTRHAWGGTAAALGSLGFYAIAMDHRGHGDSTWAPDGDYELSAFVGDLIGVIEHIGRPPVLVGASLGGMTALIAESGSPRSVARGIVLVDITPHVQKQGVLRILDFMKGSSEGFASLEEAADAVSSYLPHRRRRKDLGGLSKNLRLRDDGRYRWHWDPRVLDIWDPDTFTPAEGERLMLEREDASRRLTVPTLLVRGRMSDVVTEEQAQEFLALAPHAEYVDLEGAAHMVAGDKNDAFTDAVADFIQRHFAEAG